MTIKVVRQPRSTYQLWARFSFPASTGPRDAIAIPASIAHQLNSAYTIMLTALMAKVWIIVIALAIFLVWRAGSKHPEGKKQMTLLASMVTLWNKRSDLIGFIFQAYQNNSGKSASQRSDPLRESKVWLALVMFLALLASAAEKVLGVLVPPLLILGSAAPVNPDAIYFPPDFKQGEADDVIAARFTLEAPAALRALSSVDLGNQALREKVRVGQAVQRGRWKNDELILQVDYGYEVSGAELGLQRYPDLLLVVNGSCITEYSWHSETDSVKYLDSNITTDTYRLPFDPSAPQTVSVLDGSVPMGSFLFDGPFPGALEKSNSTWLALVSSVGRGSFTPGTDPWYLTDKDANGSPSRPRYIVNPARPVLSCWQDNVWSYKGRSSSIQKLDSEALPGLELSEAMQWALRRYLDAPMIYHVGSRLGASALKSATVAFGSFFDAGASSFQKDLERLVMASYIATTNVLTDSTLHPAEKPTSLPNVIRAENNHIMDGVADFVVWSQDVSALSIVVVAALPILLLAVWLLSIVLLNFTRLEIANLLDADCIFTQLMNNHPQTTLSFDGKDGPAWGGLGEKKSDQSTVSLLVAPTPV
ncbi:hypothetical protein ED733_008974 [Metarhizium rileyi]|uniref:Uncharacterized protein n=1 Tax=Metarhizium rileyi (strain RCEF 4871) TaxID=1649241 RepID=A0A5C6GNI7_METRR|nr:hypothetical protein ED733_008974 [Metarhizium rileyi]